MFYYTANIPGFFGINKKKVIFPGFQDITTKKRGFILAILLVVIIFETLNILYR